MTFVFIGKLVDLRMTAFPIHMSLENSLLFIFVGKAVICKSTNFPAIIKIIKSDVDPHRLESC